VCGIVYRECGQAATEDDVCFERGQVRILMVGVSDLRLAVGAGQMRKCLIYVLNI